MHWWGSEICVSHRVFLSGCPAIRVSLWTTYPSSVRILSCWDCSGLLLPYHSLHASGWLWSLEAPVVDLGMSLFLVDIPHQSRVSCRHTTSKPLHKATREDMWPVSTSLTIKLYGCKQELEKTTSFISLVALNCVDCECQEEEETCSTALNKCKLQNKKHMYTCLSTTNTISMRQKWI